MTRFSLVPVLALGLAAPAYATPTLESGPICAEGEPERFPVHPHKELSVSVVTQTNHRAEVKVSVRSPKRPHAERQAGARRVKRTRLSALPVVGMQSSPFGMRRHPILRRRKMHNGIDFAAHKGTQVTAAGDGVVITAGWRGGYGRLVTIDHGKGLHTRYAHLSRFLVKRGDKVTAGQDIALVGETGRATGPHLHFEVRRRGRAINPKPMLARIN